VLLSLTLRLLMAALVAVLVTVLLGLVVHLVPGDPARTILGPQATPMLVRQVRHQMGLDQPLPLQVWTFLSGAARGDLGRDFLSQQPVTQLIGQALPHTLVLAVSALALAVLGGVPLGAYAATHPGHWIDRMIATVSVSLITVPAYVSGLLLLLLFAVTLGWLPAINAGSFSDPLDYLRHLLLPAVALGATWLGYLARLVRAGMLEALNSPYIQAARALGLPARVIVYKYALKNAIIPTVAILGVGLGNLMGGAVFVELIFNRPGMGTLLFDAIENRNFPVLRGGALVIALLFVLANLLADLSYRLLDPRIKVGARG
jgi:peptide/nickel transport system permease protein